MTLGITSALPTSDEYVLPCAGKWPLFDSTARADQLAAALLCMSCKARPACAKLRDEIAADVTARANLVGTWAGKSYGGQKVAPRQVLRSA